MKITVLLAALLFVSTIALRAGTEKESLLVPPSVLRTYDKDKSGALDEKEHAKWQADLAARRDKQAKQRADMLAKYDLDKDGKLSSDEAASAKIGMNKARTEQDMVKGKEKAGERIAREMADKEMQERLAASKAAGDESAEGSSMMMAE